MNLQHLLRIKAEETLSIIKAKKYVTDTGVKVDISKSLAASVKGTVYYPDPIEDSVFGESEFVLEVLNETTAEAGLRLIGEGYDDPVVLNFASAKNPGGGWLHGAKAQEEALARCSGMYECIRNKPMFYNNNIIQDDEYYTDGIIYSPKVPFFRSETLELLDKPFELSVITAPAPDLWSMTEEDLDDEKVKETLERRAMKILQVAQKHGHKAVVLGAWGCGFFKNDPKEVVDAFMKALDELAGFKRVSFPIYDAHEGTPTFNTFNGLLREHKYNYLNQSTSLLIAKNPVKLTEFKERKFQVTFEATFELADDVDANENIKDRLYQGDIVVPEDGDKVISIEEIT